MKQAYRLSNTGIVLVHTGGIVFLLLVLMLVNYIRPKKQENVCIPASIYIPPFQPEDEKINKDELIRAIQATLRDTEQIVHDGIIIYQKK